MISDHCRASLPSIKCAVLDLPTHLVMVQIQPKCDIVHRLCSCLHYLSTREREREEGGKLKRDRKITMKCDFFPQVDYKKVAKSANMARNTRDIQDSWDSVLSTIEFYGENKDNFAEAAGPGFWNDPDMVRSFTDFLHNT